MFPMFIDPVYEEIDRQERERKKIDRIARQAEAQQRFQKGGHWV